MARQTWTLTNATSGVHESDFSLAASELPDAGGNWKITQKTLHGGLSEGVSLVEIDNGRMQLSVIPTRGMGIWRAQVNDEATLGWRSPNRGPVHPQFVPIHDSSGLGWLEGFDELVVRCGLESNGAPEFGAEGQLLYPLHGRIANRPAHHVEVTVDDSAGTITLRGLVEETRFHFQKLRLEASVTTSFDSNSFTIRDEVINFGGTAAEMQMLYHINLGEPLLGAGSEVVAPVESLRRNDSATAPTEGWSLFEPPTAGAVESCYFLNLTKNADGHSQVLLKSADQAEGVCLDFDRTGLPYFTLWKNEVASADGYVAGLEPATNYPNRRSDEAKEGRVIRLLPNETWSSEFSLNWLRTTEEVEQTEQAIKQLSAKS